LWKEYFEKVLHAIEEVKNEESENIEISAKAVFDTLESDGLIYVFGTGHSHMLAEEMFYRAGGLVTVYPVLSSCFMLHEGAEHSSESERTPGLARRLLESYRITSKDLLLIISNSGVNCAPVEAALYAKEIGLRTVAVTSLAHSLSVTPKNLEGARLFEIADIVIDNHIPPGDALMEIGSARVAPASTAIGATILNSIVTEVAWLFAQKGKDPPVFISANIEDGNLQNSELIRRYKRRIPIL
jgi:uncharacterized phosphosugar-binding protein